VSDQGSQTRYLQVTPSGAFYATVNSHPDEARAILLQLLSSNEPIEFSYDIFAEIADLELNHAKTLFNRLLARRFLVLTGTPIEQKRDSLETVLASILPALSSSGKVILGDDQGFCLASSGFDANHAESLAALSADLISLHQRHQHILNDDLELMGQSWGMLDPVGNSQLGNWIIHIGSQVFVLVIQEQPLLNQHQFVELLSALASRYLDN
jgi:hypothetical protein